MSNTNPTKIQSELGCPGRVSSSCPSTGTRRFTFVASLMNEEKPGLRLRQTEHIRGHLWQQYSTVIAVRLSSGISSDTSREY